MGTVSEDVKREAETSRISKQQSPKSHHPRQHDNSKLEKIGE